MLEGRQEINRTMNNPIKYVTGDATAPINSGNKIIVHICNDIGGWGRGFVLAVSKKWSEPEKSYREWHKSQKNFALGEVQFIKVNDNTWVANLIGQRDTRHDEKGNPPIRYQAVKEGLQKVGQFAKENNASIHMPRIGCGLAGGTWDKMEPIIVETLSENKLDVTVYDLA